MSVALLSCCVAMHMRDLSLTTTARPRLCGDSDDDIALPMPPAPVPIEQIDLHDAGSEPRGVTMFVLPDNHGR